MTSFGYRFNPLYAIKECSSCGTLYTRDCVCSIGTVEDKILVPKPPKNCARCTRCGYLVDGTNCHGCALLRQELEETLVEHSTYFQNSSEPSNARTVEDKILVPKPPKNCARYTRCGYLVDGPNCQGCALLRQELEENLVTYSPDFQNSFEQSNASTNVVNAPRELYVVKQDNGSFVDNINFDLNRAPDSPNQFHCFHYQIENFSESNEEFSSTDEDSFSFDKIDYVEASPPDSELVNSEVMEIVIPEVGGIDDDILLTINHDDLHEKLRNVNLLISKIKALNANPTLSSDCKTKSSSTSLNSLLEETNNFDNSLPEFETFCFDVEEISSGSTTAPPDISLPEYEVFYDNHVKEISSGSPTTHSDSSLYATFMFDLSINPFPPADRSVSYEFTDELIPFISAPEYDRFRFTVEPNSRDFTKDVVENISPTKEPQVLTVLPTHPTLQLNMKFQPSKQSSLGCSSVPFLSPLILSSMGEYGPAHLTLNKRFVGGTPCLSF
nr:hypothetical protein [Tanacetum cinerariifolium]